MVHTGYCVINYDIVHVYYNTVNDKPNPNKWHINKAENILAVTRLHVVSALELSFIIILYEKN